MSADKHRRQWRDLECDENVVHCGSRTFRCTHGWSMLYCSICLCFTALIVFMAVLHDLFDFCAADGECQAGVCERGVCSTVCRVEPIPNCCVHHDDCPAVPCHENLCVDNTCRAFPTSGELCDDGSECTQDDVCKAGVCSGTAVARRCQTCVDSIFVQDPDGTPCDDADVCTTDATCQAGTCQGVPKQCPNKTCNVGVCRPDVGCAFAPTNEVDNPSMCVDAQCVDGVYSETHKNCFDGNPCTLDACYPLTGICVNPPADAGGCTTTCTQDADCHAIGSNAQYACWDGNCADITAGEMIIRTSHAEIDFDGCPADHARLQLRFFMDSEVQNNLFHIPLTESVQGIYPDMQAFDVMSEHRGNGVRSYFSMRTTCRDLRVDCYPFLHGEYEFVVKRYPCHTLTGAHCLMQPDPTYVMLPLTLVDCPYDIHRVVDLLPELQLDQRGWEVNASVHLEEQSPWITDVTLCVPKELPLAACIANEDVDDCPYRGCDVPAHYLDERIHFVSDSNYTAAMTTYSSSYNVRMALGYANYDGDRCASDHNVDWLSFNMLALKDRYEGRTAVLDVGYTVPVCAGRRLSSAVHTVGAIVI